MVGRIKQPPQHFVPGEHKVSKKVKPHFAWVDEGATLKNRGRGISATRPMPSREASPEPEQLPPQPPARKDNTRVKDDWQKHHVSNDQNKLAYYASQAAYGDKAYAEKLTSLGYGLDSSLSEPNNLVFYNQETKHGFVAYRGTADLTDVKADAQLTFGNYDGDEFQKAYRIFGRAIDKYGKNFTPTGHSLGGTKAIKVSDRFGPKSIVFNPGTGLLPLVTGGNTVFQNTDDIISKRVKGEQVVQFQGGHSLATFGDLFE